MTPPWEPTKLPGGRNALSMIVLVRLRGKQRGYDKYLCLEEWFLMKVLDGVFSMNVLENGLKCKELLRTEKLKVFMLLRRSLILARDSGE
jgi:hypothetical protein